MKYRRRKSFKRKFFSVLLVSVIALLSASLSHGELPSLQDVWDSIFLSSPSPTQIPATGTIEVAFSPNNSATRTIVKAINEAQKNIWVQAYSFTSKDIGRALIKARDRNVAVQVILDKSQQTDAYSSARFLYNQRIPLRIDHEHAIAHNKVMVIDESTVITGSFNFTRAAETSNAENVLVMRGNPNLVKLYLQNWRSHWLHAVAYKPEPIAP